MTKSCKSSWPELVGYSGESAAAIIERQNTNVDAIVVPEGSVVTADIRCTRVWVWVNKAGKVYKTPVIG
ncbi:hypothetical protein MKW94_026627 [Papaver nudicaule]|uniref:Uncharacterized protein n=1 Tax=Papaver nudicaule TaxID=74823 RepID=A0AA41S849_PAPNU|nr:hypothetical protein [Papaver nudicaule]MCL7030550.1 hypothetical protein [Papaver nudicaule]MCL7047251.1 hypothetical protein [Papaver nudicaule]